MTVEDNSNKKILVFNKDDVVVPITESIFDVWFFITDDMGTEFATSYRTVRGCLDHVRLFLQGSILEIYGPYGPVCATKAPISVSIRIASSGSRKELYRELEYIYKDHHAIPIHVEEHDDFWKEVRQFGTK